MASACKDQLSCITSSLCRSSFFFIINKNKSLSFREGHSHLFSGGCDNPLNSSPRHPHELPSLFLSQSITITKPERFQLITVQFYPIKFT